MNTILRFIFLMTVAIFFYLNKSSATDYYLSNAGDDNNTGTSPETAWKTISKLNTQMALFTPGSRILFNRGDVFVGQINFNKNGSETNPIIIEAYGTGDNPVISAAVPAENWEQHSGNIWKTTISEGNVLQIFSNGKRLPVARYPNSGYLRMKSINPNAAEFSDSDPLIAGKTENFFKGAKVVFMPRDWYWVFPTVTSSSTDGLIKYDTFFSNLVGGLGYFFTDKFEFIDSEDEWYFENSTNTLYIYSASNPTGKNIMAAVYDYGIVCPYNAQYVTIQNLRFEYQNKDGLSLEGKESKNNGILNCEFNGQIKSGISAGGTMITIDGNKLDDICGRAINIDAMKNSSIKKNSIRKIGLYPGLGNAEVHDMVGIKAWNSDSLTIQENVIDSTGYNGLSFIASNMMIKWNLVSNSLLKASDGAGIYVYSDASYENTFLNNFVENITGNVEARPVNTHIYGNGIYIDNYAHNSYIFSNTVNNIDGFGIVINANAHHIQVYKNNVYNCNVSFRLADYLPGKTVYDNVSSQNVFYANKNGSIPLEIESNDNNYDVFLSSDNNYLCNPLEDKVARYTMYTSKTFTMAEWQSQTAYDHNSFASLHSWTPQNNRSFLLSNKTNASKTYNFDPNTVFDLKDKSLTTLTIKPYSSQILISSSVVTGIETIELFKEIVKIFPNPARNKVTIQAMNGQVAAYKMISLTGQIIAQGTITGSFNELNIENINEGIYVIEFFDGNKNKMYSTKLIKQ